MINMKLLFYLPISIGLTGCLVSSSSNLHLKNAQAGSWMTWFQKRDQLGYTDYNQRIKDFYACGIPKDQIIDEHWTMWTVSDNEMKLSNEEFKQNRRKTIKCMERKGYIYSSIQCGTVSNPTGICK